MQGRCPWPLIAPYPIIVYSVSNNYYRPHLSHFLGKCYFRDPNLITFNFCVYLILNEEQFTFHLQYIHSGMFANRKCEKLSYPQNPKMCNPILVTPLKMQPHYSQSRHENATPSSGKSPLASYEEVPPSPAPSRLLLSIF